MTKSITVALFAIAIVSLAACAPTSSTTPSATSNTSSQQTTTTQNATGGAVADEKVDYTIELSNFKFSPNTIEAKPGQTLRVKLTSSGGMHNFIIDDLKVKSDNLAAGKDQIISITVPADAAGKSYEFYCGMGNHRQMGMVGTLTVMAK